VKNLKIGAMLARRVLVSIAKRTNARVAQYSEHKRKAGLK